MSLGVVLEKRRLRAELKARRATLAPGDRARASNQACAALMASALWRQAERVALFHAMPDEVSTRSLLESAWRDGRRVALPVTPPLGSPLVFRWVEPTTPLKRARYGALEPEPSAARARLDALQLVVVPGLGFDERGARLGAGGGYYDRTLSRTGPGVMLAFSCQRLDRVPEEAHDRRVVAVATELGWMWSSPGAPPPPGPVKRP
ncbi:MAG: 5-formyltetrahydrofolate cyclo-ligase [Alphaproteobacteria bacterium]|nr:5-formyltetrahydrofolate cyclo-ligase [Alphaproteobacteria bacterium]